MNSASDSSVGGYSPFVDSYVLSIKDFGDGEREVMVQRYDRRVHTAGELLLKAKKMASGGSGRAARTRKGDPGPWDEAFDLEAFHDWRERTKARAVLDQANRERAARRSRSECCARLKAIKADRMITLTYRENMVDRERLARDWKEFVRRVRRVAGFEYVATHERQKRGAWHMHVGVRGRQNYRLLGAIWRSIGGGFVRVTNPFKQRALRHKLAAYMSKYIAKNAEEGERGERRMWCSKGIEPPQREVYGGVFSDWQSCVDEARAYLDEERPLVAWYSRRRRVLFFATTNPC